MTRNIYALLVGINEYPNPENRLKGCIRDIEGWKHCLEGQAGATNAMLHPLMLQDKAATHGAIIETFARHLCQAEEGDAAVFCFAGHGSFMAGQKAFNQTPDETNQTLVCWDSRLEGNRDLVDKELSNLVAKVAEKNPQITLILDCCHSGSASRDREVVERQIEPQWLGVSQRNFYSFDAAEQDMAEVSRGAGDGSSFVLRQGRHILLAACHETQTAKEVRIDGVPRGVFSAALQSVLAKAAGAMTYEDLITEAGLAIERQQVKEQSPQMEVIKGGARDHALFFLSGEQQAVGQDIFTLAYQDGWRVNGGRAHGWMARGVRLPVFDLVGARQVIASGTDQLGEVTIEEIQTGFSRAVPVGELNLDKSKTYKVVAGPEISSTELTVFLKGKSVGVETLRRSFEEMYSGLAQAKLVDDESEASVILNAAKDTYEIFRGPKLDGAMTVPVASRPFSPLILTDVAEPLRRIERWLRLYELFVADGGADSEVTFQLSQDQVVKAGMDFRLVCDRKNDRWVVPNVQFLVTNSTSSRLYCAMLYLSPEFGINPGSLYKC